MLIRPSHWTWIIDSVCSSWELNPFDWGLNHLDQFCELESTDSLKRFDPKYNLFMNQTSVMTKRLYSMTLNIAHMDHIYNTFMVHFVMHSLSLYWKDWPRYSSENLKNVMLWFIPKPNLSLPISQAMFWIQLKA